MRKIFDFQTLLLAAALLISGCASSQTVTEQSVDEKLARLQLGQTTMAEVEGLFGTPQGKDPHLWVYNLSDTAVEIATPQTAILSGMMPMVPMSAPTNTKALVVFRFSQAGIVKGLEVSRYFTMPFTSNYSYLVKESAANTLNSVAQAAEVSGFKVGTMDKAAGNLALEDVGSKARINVTLEHQILQLNTINPNDRLSNAYRVFTKRQEAFGNRLASAEILQ